ncbi:hypothetical protein TPAR_07565 [Tolypocladium paradoxum]|uniref:Uncharacterized protein n=1 Tax=Tolypocladium paradoxum TaxID=94208 RepID=A0A2S4KPW4_9HYPO|nr:hypothetical protein TPAR_07565 [Tolypocladium paradoxum]
MAPIHWSECRNRAGGRFQMPMGDVKGDKIATRRPVMEGFFNYHGVGWDRIATLRKSAEEETSLEIALRGHLSVARELFEFLVDQKLWDIIFVAMFPDNRQPDWPWWHVTGELEKGSGFEQSETFREWLRGNPCRLEITRVISRLSRQSRQTRASGEAAADS